VEKVRRAKSIMKEAPALPQMTTTEGRSEMSSRQDPRKFKHKRDSEKNQLSEFVRIEGDTTTAWNDTANQSELSYSKNIPDD